MADSSALPFYKGNERIKQPETMESLKSFLLFSENGHDILRPG